MIQCNSEVVRDLRTKLCITRNIIKLLVNSIPHREVKLGMHVYSIMSMTTTNKKSPRAIFFKITSSLLKLAQYSTPGGETWYACVYNRFHDNHQKIAPGNFLQNYFFTPQTRSI